MKIFNNRSVTKTLSLAAVALVASVSTVSVRAFDYPDPGDFALGAQQWANNCTRCHNMRGPNELRDDQWITTMFHMRVRGGLTGEETRNILTFIQDSNNSLTSSLLNKTSGAVASQSGHSLSGKAIYDQTCIACHGSNGKGAIPGVPDLTDAGGRLSQSDGVLLINIIRGMQSPGSTMAMPPKGGNPTLSEEDIRSVLEYLRSSFGA